MNEITSSTPDGSRIENLARNDGSRIPYEVYSSQEIYDLEQERIFRGPTWSFVALEVELPNPGDFKSTFVGATPVVVTRNDDRSLSGGSIAALIVVRWSVVRRAATHGPTSAHIISGATTRAAI